MHIIQTCPSPSLINIGNHLYLVPDILLSFNDFNRDYFLYSKDTQSKSWFSSFLSEEKQDEQRINDFFSQLELDELSRLIFLESVLINIFIIISCSIGIGRSNC